MEKDDSNEDSKDCDHSGSNIDKVEGDDRQDNEDDEADGKGGGDNDQGNDDGDNDDDDENIMIVIMMSMLTLMLEKGERKTLSHTYTEK